MTIRYGASTSEIPYSKDPKDIAIRDQMRRKLDTVDEKKRAELLREADFKEAALETHHALSGMSPLAHQQLRNEYVNSHFPDVVKTVNNWKLAHEEVGQTFKTVSAQIENELLALGERWVEAQPARKQREPWK
jgi:hypothetical protein